MFKKWRLRQKLELLRLKLNNYFRRTSCLQDDGPVVSMTTYGERAQTVYLSLESIARGSLRPKRLILWVDDTAFFNALPSSIKRLQRRGLEVYLTENYGPHTKYYPYLLLNEDGDAPLVTADDDIFYPRHWLQALWQSYLDAPQHVHCHRAWRIGVEKHQNVLTPYSTWQLCNSTQPSFLHFATGVSGVLYPSIFLGYLRRAGDDFKQLCPRADDIWLHVQALRADFRIKQIAAQAHHFRMVPNTQQEGLYLQNREEGGNDAYIATTYLPTDIAMLLKAASEIGT